MSAARGIAVAALAAAALLVGGASLGRVLAQSAPRAAARLAPGDGVVLGEHARATLTADISAASLARARAQSLAALRADPTSVAALSTLGSVTHIAGGADAARAIFVRADALSRRDLQTHLWWIEQAAAKGDVARALHHYDLALRTSPRGAELLFPVLTDAIADDAVRQALAARLHARPIWTDGFLMHAATLGDDPATVGRLFATLHRRGVALPGAGLPVLLARLVERQQADAAWRLFAQIRPAAARPRVRNAAFAGSVADPTIYDWAFTEEGGRSAAVVGEGPDARLTTSVASGGGGRLARQAVRLAPGRYRLATTFGDLRVGGGVLALALHCADDRELVRMTLSDQAPPVARSQPLTVDAACGPIQWLVLDAVPTDSPRSVETELRRIDIVPA